MTTPDTFNLDAYFGRIGYAGPCEASLETLAALHTAHLGTIPFENLDVLLGRRIRLDLASLQAKLVEGHRGGYCFEQNTLFAAVLRHLGFQVTTLEARVRPPGATRTLPRTHMVLRVELPDRAVLADVGFGGSLLEPIRLEECEHLHDPFRLGLRHLDDGLWQFWENAGDGEFSYDFRPEPANEDALARKCEVLQTDPESSFVLNLVAQSRTPKRHSTLRGRVLTHYDASGATTSTLQSPDQLLQTLAGIFGLDVPEIAACWPKVLARHRQLFGEE